jgi:undecaprenyl pyrophosphate phosphatase UppP
MFFVMLKVKNIIAVFFFYCNRFFFVSKASFEKFKTKIHKVRKAFNIANHIILKAILPINKTRFKHSNKTFGLFT